MENLKFIKKLSQKEFKELVLKFFQEETEINKFEALSVKKVKNNIYIYFEGTLFKRKVAFNDFYAEYKLFAGIILPTQPQNKSQIVRDYLYTKFGEEYLNALKIRLEEDKNKKVEEFKNNLEEENKKSINNLAKQENKKSKDIYEKILDKFKI